MSKVNRLSDETLRQLDAFLTPGSLLKAARLRRGLTEQEVAQHLKILPDYVPALERDDYAALRSPAFARGYVRSYGRLLDLDPVVLQRAFDELAQPLAARPAARSRPLQLQRTGVGVVVGLCVLFVLVLALWWLGTGEAGPAWSNSADRSSLPLSPPAAVSGERL